MQDNGNSVNGNDLVLGTYDSETRCIEVIDEIQKMFLKHKKINNSNRNSVDGWETSFFIPPKVYEMPPK